MRHLWPWISTELLALAAILGGVAQALPTIVTVVGGTLAIVWYSCMISEHLRERRAAHARELIADAKVPKKETE